MIQRIQTFFLALSLLLMGLLIWLHFGEIAVADKIYSFSLSGMVDIQTGQNVYRAWHLIGLAVTILLLQFIIIFSYKNRVKQARLANINILLMLGFIIVCWLSVMLSAKSLGNGVYSLKVYMALPFISVFMNYLAIRAIKRDEALVRSVDRIR
jgi:hypothetical protein